jgi:hypothetical protein
MRGIRGNRRGGSVIEIIRTIFSVSEAQSKKAMRFPITDESSVDISWENLLIILPIGVESNQLMGACIMAVTRRSCTLTLAFRLASACNNRLASVREMRTMTVKMYSRRGVDTGVATTCPSENV